MKTLTAVILLALTTACGEAPVRAPDQVVDGGSVSTADAGLPWGTQEFSEHIPDGQRLDAVGCGDNMYAKFDPQTDLNGGDYWVRWADLAPGEKAQDADLQCEWLSPYASWRGILTVHFTTESMIPH